MELFLLNVHENIVKNILKCFHVHLIKIIPKWLNFGSFLGQKGNFKPLTLNNVDVCYFAFWMVQDFFVENFLFTILNMFFTMFSCTFNKNNSKMIKFLVPFWAKKGILNLWLWIMLMFVILLFGWYKTSLLKISYLQFSICSSQCFHVHLIKIIPKWLNFWLLFGRKREFYTFDYE